MGVPRCGHTGRTKPEQRAPHAQHTKPRLKPIDVFQPGLRGGLQLIVVPCQSATTPSHDVRIAPDPEASSVGGLGTRIRPCSRSTVAPRVEPGFRPPSI